MNFDLLHFYEVRVRVDLCVDLIFCEGDVVFYIGEKAASFFVVGSVFADGGEGGDVWCFAFGCEFCFLDCNYVNVVLFHELCEFEDFVGYAIDVNLEYVQGFGVFVIDSLA